MTNNSTPYIDVSNAFEKEKLNYSPSAAIDNNFFVFYGSDESDKTEAELKKSSKTRRSYKLQKVKAF